ncbi:hypothetical protein AMJ71_10350 [candidate division TA06 bacterium SM1_40]|uniref:FlgD Ig-like domain-containing protein n=2 Tax=Bacteria division TA06 TaxID=1156500 RepID=A0A0S8J8K7_UNCT6|nr:MAG: hypothetical protein AMJ82_09815 [candidate division TA06 bacterium SM23_40]KPL05946.1 MAG: hypothetical protein AMJ71_10350 [candidate division TA06 bacterium SM1_40]
MQYNVRDRVKFLGRPICLLAAAMSVAIIGAFASPARAQNLLLNPGFEAWTGNIPDEWVTPNIPPILEPVTPSTNAYSGQYAAQCAIVQFIDTTYGGWVMQNTGASGRAFTFDFEYLLSGTGSEYAWAEVLLFAGPLAVGAWYDSLDLAPSYTHRTGIAEVIQGQPDADSAFVWLGIFGDQVGSYALFDDVSLTPGVLVDGGDENSPSEFCDRSRIVSAAPNPFRERIAVEYAVSRPERVSIRVYAITGQLVDVLVERRENPGRHRVLWDGCDSRGDRLANGVYFCRLRVGDEVDSRKILFVK